MTPNYADILATVTSSTLVDPERVARVTAKVAAGDLTEQAGAKILDDLYHGRRLADLSEREVGTEWLNLLAGMQEEAAQWQTIARQQYRQGFYLLPIAVLVVFALAILGSRWLNVSETVITALGAATLAALAAHSFFVFRVHQQARIAAERLSEKRAAVLFLQAALLRATETDAPTILASAAAMFLGHYAPETIPLKPDDAPRKS